MTFKNTVLKISNMFLLSIPSLLLAGCSGGGGGGSSAGSSGSGAASSLSGAGTSGAGTFAGSTLPGAGSDVSTFTNPEPSSLLLLASGLVGMAVYARKRLKSKNKK